MTDKRLLCAASMVRDGALLADIGTDHAHLPVYLIKNDRCVSAIAADIGEGPAASARRTVEAAGLQDRIEVRVGDGLSVLAPTEATDIVIAGMGGETIIAILQAAPWLQDGFDRRLILQPMTKTVELRTFLLTNGFAIDEEHLIKDGRHLYLVMAVHFCNAALPSSDLAFYIGALDRREGRPYFAQQLSYLSSRANGLRQSGDDAAAAEYESIAAKLSDYMEDIL